MSPEHSERNDLIHFLNSARSYVRDEEIAFGQFLALVPGEVEASDMLTPAEAPHGYVFDGRGQS
jgi:hypothetical protein